MVLQQGRLTRTGAFFKNNTRLLKKKRFITVMNLKSQINGIYLELLMQTAVVYSSPWTFLHFLAALIWTQLKL